MFKQIEKKELFLMLQIKQCDLLVAGDNLYMLWDREQTREYYY